MQGALPPTPSARARRRAAPRALVPRKPWEDDVHAGIRASSDGEASLLFTSARPAGLSPPAPLNLVLFVSGTANPDDLVQC